MPMAFPDSDEADERAARVLAAFEQRAAVRGIRAVVMSELARDLGMSTKTLYRTFPTKDALVAALMTAWADDLRRAQAERLASVRSPVEHIRAVAHETIDHRDRFSATFWSDLAADHAGAWATYQATVAEAMGRARDWLGPLLRPGLSIEVAGPVLVAAIVRATDPRLCDAAGLTRHQAVDQAIDVWAGGALARRPPARPTRPTRTDHARTTYRSPRRAAGRHEEEP